MANTGLPVLGDAAQCVSEVLRRLDCRHGITDEEIEILAEALPVHGAQPQDLSIDFVAWFLAGLRTARNHYAERDS